VNPTVGPPHPLRRQISASLSRCFVAGERAGDLLLPSPVGFEFDDRVEWISSMLERGDVHDEDYRMFRTLTEADGVFLDIGANYEYSAVSVWATGATCAVISFEPILAFEPCAPQARALRLPDYEPRVRRRKDHVRDAGRERGCLVSVNHGIVNLSGRGMLVVSVAPQLG
jgi:hypothetical protein